MKKFLSMLLAAMMIASVMSFAAAEEPFEITVMLPDFCTDSDYQTENNPVLDFIEQETGVRLNIQFVANSAYGDMLSYTLADPANMPMLMVATGPRDPIIINSARNGAFWDITDMIKDYEWLSKGSEGVYNNISIDGRLYGIYRSRQQVRAGIFYRCDVAAEHGVTEEPKTIADLTALADALLEHCKETEATDYVLNMVKYVDGTIGYITVTHGAPYKWGVDEAGNIYPAHKSADFREGLNWLRDLYAKGGINPDFMNIESGEWDKIGRNSQAYMRFDCMDTANRQQTWFETNEGVTDIIYALLPGVEDVDGTVKLWPQNAGYSGEVVITKAVKEADLPKVMKFLDWCNSPVGTATLNWGVEGETYWIREDGLRYASPSDDVDMTAQINRLQGSLNQLGMSVAGDYSPKAETKPLRAEYDALNIPEYTKLIVNDPCHALTSETNVMMGTTLSQMLEDAHVQYIAGIIDEAGLEAVYEEWAMMGGDMMTQEYNEAYQATK